MKCRTCGTDIAANALICYRCGTATAEARTAPPRPATGRRWLTPVMVLVVILVGVAVWALLFSR